MLKLRSIGLVYAKGEKVTVTDKEAAGMKAVTKQIVEQYTRKVSRLAKRKGRTK